MADLFAGHVSNNESHLISGMIRRRASATRQVGVSQPHELPEDLLRLAAKRLRIIALLFGFGFLVANFFPPVFDPRSRVEVFGSFAGWGPGAISITMALIVVGLASSARVPPRTLMNVGLVFGVAGSFGIAMASYWGIYAGLEYEPAHLDPFGPGYVAPWIIAFTIVVPNEPRKSLLAALASASSVPITMALTMKYGGTTIAWSPAEFFIALILPYLLVIMMAYVGAHVVYKLGTDVTRAREMGSYGLVERLGSGGMGEVWLAKHRMLARPAAIKLVRPEVLGEADSDGLRIALTRFEREAQATASMRSPHTIELYDFGVSDDGTFYYVMELLDGFDLETLVRKFGPVPPERAIHLLRQACDSLGEAHQEGLIHRDIKPANMYVCRHGRKVDFIKVLDFGLVKSRREPSGDDIKLTAANVVGGTPAYMAPEQVAGDLPIDGRTDIYALGCVGYWLLTGQVVFEGPTVLNIMVQHLKAEPVPPSQRTELEVPASLEKTVLSCLEKDPDRRPQSADALSEVLAACETRQLWTPERAQHWWDMHRPRAAVTS